MFGYAGLFSFFSRYTFHSLSKYNFSPAGEYQSPGLEDSSSPDAIEDQASEKTEAVQPSGETETPEDSIELTSHVPESTPEVPPAIYSPEMIVKDVAEDDPEPPAENQPDETDDDVLLARSKASARLNLDMVFNLAEFTQTVAALAEDAEDGEINTLTYSDLAIGLHTDLKAKAFIKEDYRILEGEGNPLPTAHSKQWSLFNRLEATLMRSRGFEAAAFYRESLNTSQKLRQTYSQGFLRVARKLSMRYTQDFQLNLRALNLYNNQAQALDQTGNIGAYLGNVEIMADSPDTPGDLIGQFFEAVQSYLDGAEDKLIEKIDAFFENLAAEMGVDTSFLDGARESLISSVDSFFDRVDQAVGSIEGRYIESPEEPEPIEPPGDMEPSTDPEIRYLAEASAG
jgi:hypothetical protein